MFKLKLMFKLNFFDSIFEDKKLNNFVFIFFDSNKINFINKIIGFGEQKPEILIEQEK